ncbi:MAG: translation elongation factor 4 [Verrucomicrobiota bacterium]
MKNIRNFAIIAHIDHGKSTIADRFLLHTHTVEEREFRDQVLDDMDLERERGITIKSHPVRMLYEADDRQWYQLNLIDTPGHVDFAYEVSRSLAACEGVLLVVDAAQGVQAQTVANVNLALQQNLPIIPVINKIDLPAADTAMCLEQMEEMLAIPADECLLVSAKEGKGIKELLEAVVCRIGGPAEPEDDVLRALVFDSVYNKYRGVIGYVRVLSGKIRAGQKIRLFKGGVSTDVKEVGSFRPAMQAGGEITSGEVGYVITGIKDPADIQIGDTITDPEHPCSESLPGFRKIQPMVFSGIYPVDGNDYENLKYSISKLQLNDSAFFAQPENSIALGAGFRCGFLGVLHMEITQERLQREYEVDVILTYPSVIYHVYLKGDSCQEVDNPVNMPDPANIERIEEPIIRASIITPADFLGNIMNLIMNRRGEVEETHNADSNHVIVNAIMPLHEVVVDFYDQLKTITKGYGSLDYKTIGYRADNLVRLDILINGESVDAFSCIIHRDQAHERGRAILEKLKDVIPRQLFGIALQAAVGGKVVAREDVKALKKNVTAKCYGGDITRKRKLLEKQKQGKKRMKQAGQVELPQEAFVAVLKTKS